MSTLDEPDLVDPIGEPEPPEAAGEGDMHASDPLLEAVMWLCRHHGLERTEHSLTQGGRSDQPITPGRATELLRQAGFSATVVKRPPSKILGLLMPVVLLLKNGDAVILMRRVGERSARSGGARYEVVMPGTGNEVCTATEAELMPEYSGYALLAALRPQATHSGAAGDEGEADGHWFWSTIRNYMPYYRGAMVAALLSNLLMLVTGLFTSVVYDKVIPHQAMATLWSLGSAALLAIAFDFVAKQLRGHLIDIAGKKADLAMGEQLFDKAINIRLENRPESAGAFAHKLSQIEIVREFSTSASTAVMTDMPFIAVFIFMTFVVAGQLALVVLFAVPVILVMSFSIQRVLRKQMSANMAQHADLHGTLVSVVEGMEDVRAAGAEAYFAERYRSANIAAANSSLKARTIGGVANHMTLITQPLVTVIMLIWGVTLIQENKLTSGALIGAVMFASRALTPLNSVVMLAGRFQGARAAMRALNELMATPTHREPGKVYLARPEIQGQLALRDVSFAYPHGTRTHAPQVLKDINFEIRPGERVAILGKIGSGKSTILRLLGGLYEPTGGFVEADGIDLRQIDPTDFRSHVGFVSQEPRLFEGSLKDNVMLGRAHARMGRFLEVARQTGLDKLAAAHPMGYDMPVGEMGSLLSGGQRQLVALARCLVTQSQILLMDEPTSSMDAQSEMGFIQHLKSSVESQTLVVVTHRPALLSVVDRIIVVDNGRMLADGPKAKVLALLAGQNPSQQPQPVPAAVAPAAQPAPRYEAMSA